MFCLASWVSIPAIQIVKKEATVNIKVLVVVEGKFMGTSGISVTLLAM